MQSKVYDSINILRDQDKKIKVNKSPLFNTLLTLKPIAWLPINDKSKIGSNKTGSDIRNSDLKEVNFPKDLSYSNELATSCIAKMLSIVAFWAKKWLCSRAIILWIMTLSLLARSLEMIL